MDFEFEIPPLPPPQLQQRAAYFNFGANNSNTNNYNNMNMNDFSGLNSEQQAMLQQFMSIADCGAEQAAFLLSNSNWQYQTALNAFFEELSAKTNDANKQAMANNINNSGINRQSEHAPSNTPVTPPDLDFLEQAFSQLNSTFQENPNPFSTQHLINNSNHNTATAVGSNTYNFGNNYQQLNHTSNNEMSMGNSDMMQCSNGGQRPLPLLFSDAEYAASVRFNYYNN